MSDLQAQVDYLRDKIEQGQVLETNVDAVVDKIKPLVTEALSEQINSNTAEVKAFNAQAKATYHQALVNEL